jgi:hypothetical protein
MIFEPLDFMARLAALVSKPRANLTRFHGVFVGVPHQPNSKYRALVTPAKRGKGNKREENCKTGDYEPANRHAAMTCTQGHKGTTPQAGIQYRYYNLRSMRWHCQSDTQSVRFAHGLGPVHGAGSR